jgi:hypothetical protein
VKSLIKRPVLFNDFFSKPYLGLSQRLLVTDNRTSMPEHLEEYWQKNQQIWGLFWIHPTTTMGKLAEELIMIWETTEAEEWINVVDWIPF